jgi:hypothetical protein
MKRRAFLGRLLAAVGAALVPLPKSAEPKIIGIDLARDPSQTAISVVRYERKAVLAVRDWQWCVRISDAKVRTAPEIRALIDKFPPRDSFYLIPRLGGPRPV